MFFAGSLWGLLGTVFFPQDYSALETGLSMILIGVVAVALVSAAPIRSGFAAFAVPCLLPAAVSFAWGTGIRPTLAIEICVFLVIGLALGHRNHLFVREAVRARFEIAELAEQRAQALRAAEQASRAKSQFLASMSHEIRTPINGILGLSELLMQASIAEPHGQRIGMIHRSGQQLLGIVNDILDLSKIEAGKVAIQSVPFDLHELAREAGAMLVPMATGKRIGIEVAVEPGVPRRVLGDPGRLRQVLDNLLGNAIKFTDAGKIELGVRRSDPDAGGDGRSSDETVLIGFSVRDTGIGIPADRLEAVFEPFVQVEDDASPPRTGTGLGLPITRHLVALMGGALRAQSELSHGSTFSFELAFQAVPEPPAVAPKPAANRPLPAGRVLLVEDNPVNREVALAMLESVGVQTDWAEDGRQAIDAAARRRYDLILMDCQMPEMDGYEATRCLREREAGRDARTPIVALTAFAIDGDRERCLAAGMDDYLSKPFSQEELRTTLAKWLVAEREPAAVA